MKYLRVTMPNKSVWEVPATLVAQNRAEYYQDHHVEYGYTLKNNDILFDWAANNMNWRDVAEHASKVSGCSCQMTEDDFQEGWINGEKEVVEL